MSGKRFVDGRASTDESIVTRMRNRFRSAGEYDLVTDEPPPIGIQITCECGAIRTLRCAIPIVRVLTGRDQVFRIDTQCLKCGRRFTMGVTEVAPTGWSYTDHLGGEYDQEVVDSFGLGWPDSQTVDLSPEERV